jgi:CRP/FNR family transcriptional regulator, cyclic AMP receptor protein
VKTAAELQAVEEVLSGTFPGSQPATRRALVAKAEVRTFRARQTVVAQGEESRVGIILDGHLGFRRTTVDGREVMPRIISRGDIGPFLSLLHRPSTAELIALSPSRVALWPGEDFQALAVVDAGLAIDLLSHVLLGFEEIVERLDGLLYQNALRRVARILLQHADLVFGDEAVVTRAYLPALIGTSREMTGRVLRQLESDGLVQRMGRHRLRLLDAPGLARAAAVSVRDSGARNKFLVARGSPMQE